MSEDSNCSTKANKSNDILTNKQLLFVKEYLVDLNASAAAVRAGYSKKTSYEIGYENLRKPQIQNSISKALEERKERVELQADDVLKVIKNSLTYDIRKFFDESGQMKKITNLDERSASVISSIDVVKKKRSNGKGFDEVVKLKLNDRLRAAELGGRHLGLFKNIHDLRSIGEKMDFSTNDPDTLRLQISKLTDAELEELIIETTATIENTESKESCDSV